MWYILIIVSVICIAFFLWSGLKRNKKDKELDKKKEKPVFRSEEDLEEYAKPLKNGEYSPPVDFDDAE